MRVAGVLCVILFAGCSVLASPPTTIIVADKDECVRWESEVVGLQTLPIERFCDTVREVRREQIVREYW